MATAREIVSAGYLDRMISRLSTIGKGQIDRTQAGYLTAVRKGREQSPYDVRGSYAGWREVAEEARLAVNRARRLTGGGDRGPPPSSLTVAGDPDGARATRSEYHVLVEVRDPDTGSRAVVPVVVTTSGRLTMADLAALAGAQALAERSWQRSPRGGGIQTDTPTVVAVRLTGIVGI